MKRKHYYLVAGELVLQQDDDTPAQARLNTVTATDYQRFATADIAKAQQALQMLFHRRMGEHAGTVKVIDVVLLSVSYLGHMTEAEFQKMPGAATVSPHAAPTPFDDKPTPLN